MRYRQLLLLLPLFITEVQAQVPQAEDEIRRYTVEMIVFAYAQGVSPGTEIFVADKPEIDEMEAVDALIYDEKIPETVAPLASSPAADIQHVEIVRLTQQDFTMDEIYDRMRRLDVYRPLLHFGWTQPTYPEEETSARPLADFARTPPGLDGEIKLYLSRYLHLALDLELDAPATNRQATPRYADYSDQPVRYRIKENRILRNGETRYFDHPKFGVLAKITRAEDVEVEQEFLGEG